MNAVPDPMSLLATLENIRRVWPAAIASGPAPGTTTFGWPVTIRLSPQYGEAADLLHAHHGKDVQIEVGLLPFPPDPRASAGAWRSDLPDFTDAIEAEQLDRIVVQQGQTVQVPVRLRNLTDRNIVIRSSGSIDSFISWPRSKQAVGASHLAQRTPLVRSRLPTDRPVDLLLTVGSASLLQQLGYTVPTGDWAVVPIVTVQGGSRGRLNNLSVAVR